MQTTLSKTHTFHLFPTPSDVERAELTTAETNPPETENGEESSNPGSSLSTGVSKDFADLATSGSSDKTPVMDKPNDTMTSIASIQYDGDPSSAVLKSNGNNTTTTLDASLEQTKTTIEQSEEVPNTQPLTDQKMCEEPSGTEYLGQQSSAAAEKDDNSWGILKALTPELETIRLTKSADGTGSSDNGSKGYLLGRHRECDIVFTNQHVSNRHCLIYKENRMNDETGVLEDCVFIEDMSTNGTFINGNRLGRGNRYHLQHGDEIQLAKYDARKKMEYFDDRFYIFQSPQRLKSQERKTTGDTIHDRYLLDKTLGTGNFATVKLAIHRESGQRYAVKAIQKSRFKMNSKFIENLRQEIGILMALNHPCIITIQDVYDEPDFFYIVLELVKGGELFDMIIERKKFTEEESRKVMFQLLRALKYLHDRGISHRDLKPENILLVSKDANDLRIKISDFGLAKLVGEESFMRTICGTPNYVAPEVLSQQRLKGYTKAVDMWSTGVILYICLCGYPPFSEELAPPSMMEQIKKGKYQFQSPWWDGISKEAKDLIQRLLTVDPQKRYTADQALNHPWMKLTSPAQDPALAPLLDPAFAPAHTFTRGDTILSPGKAARPAAKTYKETPNKKRKTPEFVKTAATTEDTFVDETTPLVGTPKSVDSPQTISTVTTTVDGDVGDAETTNPARKRRKKGE